MLTDKMSSVRGSRKTTGDKKGGQLGAVTSPTPRTFWF